MAGEAQTNWLDVLRSALWPLMALIAVLLFASPIRTLLDKVAKNAAGEQQIVIGPLKLQLNVETAKRIAPPTKEMARALGQLSPEDIDLLLAHGEGIGRGVCTVDGARVTSWRGPVDEARTYLKFSEEGMVEFTVPPFAVNGCPEDKKRLATLTDFGKSVRRYLLQIITSTITIGADKTD